jgi:hypothetical protein
MKVENSRHQSADQISQDGRSKSPTAKMRRGLALSAQPWETRERIYENFRRLRKGKSVLLVAGEDVLVEVPSGCGGTVEWQPEPAGLRNAYPYDAEFLKDFDQKHSYDRFRSSGTRYLISGYALVAIGGGRFFDEIASMHMRRHYFQMMLLANLELASLLSVSAQISDIIAQQEIRSNPINFERHMAAVQEEFLQFIHRFRFTGVSNQVQAKEMFDMMRRHLSVDHLFSDVRTEIEAAGNFLRSRAQERSASSQSLLNTFAAIVASIALPLTFLGVGLTFGDASFDAFKGLAKVTATNEKLYWFGFRFFLFFFLFGALLFFGGVGLDKIQSRVGPQVGARSGNEHRSLHGLAGKIKLAGIVIAFGAIAMMILVCVFAK